MRSTLLGQLLGLLAFVLVFGLGISYGAGCVPTMTESAYRVVGRCYVLRYTPGSDANVTLYNSGAVDLDKANQLETCTPGYKQAGTDNSTSYAGMKNGLYEYYMWNPTTSEWKLVQQKTVNVANINKAGYFAHAVGIFGELLTEHPSAVYPTGLGDQCGVPSRECPDGDSDGVCDACDPKPDDSSVGGRKHLKGWYEINGQTVGFLTSYSPENAIFDEISWTDAAISAPGVSAVLGMGGADGYLFDSDEFVAAGGKFVYLQRPELISEMKCAPVQSLDQCSGACDEQIANETAREKVEDVPEENGMEPTTDQKIEQHAALDPPDKCSDFYSRCAKACGGSAAVESQGCVSDSETGNVKAASCSCYHQGELRYAERWEDLASVQEEPVDNVPNADDVASGGTASGTVDMGGPATGAGDDGPSGGPVDGDADGHVDGYQMGDRTVNYGPLMQGAGELAGKFPFSLARTAQEMARQFDAIGQCPQWTLPVFGHQLVVDLCIFDPVATIVRTLTAMVLGVVAYFGAMRLFM